MLGIQSHVSIGAVCSQSCQELSATNPLHHPINDQVPEHLGRYFVVLIPNHLLLERPHPRMLGPNRCRGTLIQLHAFDLWIRIHWLSI